MILKVSNFSWAQLGGVSCCLVRAHSWDWGQLVTVSLRQPCLGWLRCLNLYLSGLFSSGRLAWDYLHGDFRVPKSRKNGINCNEQMLSKHLLASCLPIFLWSKQSTGPNLDLRSGDTDTLLIGKAVKSKYKRHACKNWLDKFLTIFAIYQNKLEHLKKDCVLLEVWELWPEHLWEPFQTDCL